MTRVKRGFTLIEMVLAIGLGALLIAFCYPLLTRMLRTSLQVTGRSGLQTGMRLAQEYMVRDIHRSHTVLECSSGALSLFAFEVAAVEAPEQIVSATRQDPAGLPFFPLSGTSAPPADGSRTVLPGERIDYKLDAATATIERVRQKGRLIGTVEHDVSSARTRIATVVFESTEAADRHAIAKDISSFTAIGFGYGATGHLRRAVDATTASGVVLRLQGTVTPEGDKPEKPVVEELLSKAWLMGKLSEVSHPGAAAAWDADVDY